LPAVRAATRQAMRLLGSHFVLGQTIEEALARAGSHREFLYSFDMLGEGARTSADARHYLDSYARAIEAIGKTAGNDALPRRPGISVKLSALHPRFEPLARDRVLAELVPNLLELAQLAKRHELNFTIDAEEADRLELSLDVITATLRDASLAGWDGFGLAVQAGVCGGFQQVGHRAIGHREDNAVYRFGNRCQIRIAGAIHDFAVFRIDRNDSTWIAEVF
jgi:RHH-type proline utilization regulon transcriptional repressor/proline dehydrogenase/delta 1-pyrroline-5-carboxylate dehydrogenase